MTNSDLKSTLPSNIRQLTDTIEARKEEKQRKRLEKQQALERKKQRQFQEKLVAPIILVLTVIISFILMVFAQ